MLIAEQPLQLARTLKVFEKYAQNLVKSDEEF